jgi:non-homologous end joining protein Ku
MHQLKYLDEIRPMDEVDRLESSQKIDARAVIGKTLVENLISDKFDPGQYSDAYPKELEKLIEDKSKGQKVVAKIEKEEPGETTDIIEALKASLQVKSRPPRQRKTKQRSLNLRSLSTLINSFYFFYNTKWHHLLIESDCSKPSYCVYE